MFTPAVDDAYVYHYNGDTLFLVDRITGVTSATIADPFGSNSGYSYHGAPMLGERSNVVAFAGGAFSGRASSNVEQYDQRVLSSFDISTNTYEWSTSYAYLTAPAVADGVIYAAHNSPMSLDAIDEVTGQVLWSWAPTENGDTSFHRNIVVTRNLLFVSTNKAVYALDLATRLPVWIYPMPGMLAISAERTLYIATGAQESDGGLVAVSLK
jgi:outer membrane protein assembly factor BamB